MSTSMIFELLERGTSVMFGGDSGQSYLGRQGDEWDAHKDMALRQPRRVRRDVHLPGNGSRASG